MGPAFHRPVGAHRRQPGRHRAVSLAEALYFLGVTALVVALGAAPWVAGAVVRGLR